jgi:hypothetical protein
MENKKPEFAFEKKLGINESVFVHENLKIVLDAFHRLFHHMIETNKYHEVHCEYFRLDFRPQNLEEQIYESFPLGSAVLDLKWGSKKELEEKIRGKDIN